MNAAAQLNPGNTGPVHLAGVVDRILFRSNETGYSILVVDRGRKSGTVVVKGPTLAAEGDRVDVKGTWKVHPKFGPQVQAESIETVLPTRPDDIERYLASGVLPMVGGATATRIVAKFGADTLNMLDNQPDRVLEVPGIGKAKAAKIKAAWEVQKLARKTMLFLSAHGISPTYAVRIYSVYGDAAIEVVTHNPYRLVKDIRGIGFDTADAIAAKVGVSRDSPFRIAAGLRYVLDEAVSRGGNCGLQVERTIARAVKLLGLPGEAVTEVLAALLKGGAPDIVRDSAGEDRDCLFPTWLYRAEDVIAVRLRALARRPAAWPDATPDALAAVVDRASLQCGVVLEATQRSAVEYALTRRVSVLTGGPGTGKTSTLGVVLAALKERGQSVKLAAPTGKAAKRMQEATGHDASTVARLIGMGSSTAPMIQCDVLVVDEASMVDVPMMKAILEQLSDQAGLLLVGDVDQLPSIGPGSVLRDIITSGVVPVTRLTHIFRQAAQSAIVRNAHRIHHGMPIEEVPPDGAPAPDFYFIPAEDPGEVVEDIVGLVTHRITELTGIAPRDVQILSPMRGTETGVRALNRTVQGAVNSHPVAAIQMGDVRFGVGDRVIHTVNDYALEVMNGESGIIQSVDTKNRTLVVTIDGREVEYPSASLDELELAYATTIHKAQGSQYQAVVMPITTQHYIMLNRSILYTGITRAMRFCAVVGQPKALAMAIRNDKLEHRITRLATLASPKRTAPGAFALA